MLRVTSITLLLVLCHCLHDLAAQDQKQREITQEEYLKLMAKQAAMSKLRYATLDAVDRKKVPYLKDFLALYPDAIVSYLSFARSDFPGLSVTATLHNRYKFNLRIPIKYSADNTEIINYGSPVCHLIEIKSVQPRDDGRGGIELGGTMGGDLQKHFGAKELQKVIESKGDFSVLGFKLREKAPVKNFDLVIKSLKQRERIIE